MNDGNNFYSFKPSSPNVYLHNTGLYHVYYGEEKKKFVLEFISNKEPQIVKAFNSLELICNSTLDGVSSDLSFNRIWAYNSSQSTGFKNLVLKTNSFTTDYGIDVLMSKVQNGWKLNNLRDLQLPNTNISSSAWANISLDYFTDKVPVNINSSPSLFQFPRLRDRWLAIRLEYNSRANIKLTVNLLNTIQSISYR
jgi:hypothetical protein